MGNSIDAKTVLTVTKSHDRLGKIDCSIYDNNRLITNLTAQEEAIIHLRPGTHKVKFQHPVYRNLNGYISLKIKPDENKGIVYNCPFSPSEYSFNNSLNQQ